MSADTVSSLFPDRPIRPLPKRRIRERLTPDAAARIDYPVVLQSTTPVFVYPPYNGAREDETGARAPASRNRVAEPRAQTGRRNGFGYGNDRLEVAASRRNTVSRAGSEPLGRSLHSLSNQDIARQTSPQAPPSASSSADGYYDEPSENTVENPNNKKKRKVPTTGDTALMGGAIHVVHSVPHEVDVPRAPLQSVEGVGDVSSAVPLPYYGVGGFATGNNNVSGPGRGRYGRVRSGRSPLRTLSDSAGNWSGRNGRNGRNGKLHPSQWASPTTESSGIISTAIANAEKVNITPHGRENRDPSLFHRQQKQRLVAGSGEFTFTCDSNVPGGIAWPVTGGRQSSKMAAPTDRRQAHGQQAASSAKGRGPGNAIQGNGANATPANPPAPRQPSTGPARARPTKREVHRDINRQRATRRRGQVRENVQRQLPRKDVNVCDLCLYELLFHERPKALIRQYELKERKRRLREEEHRQALRKARKNRASRANKPATRAAVPASGAEDDEIPETESSADPGDRDHDEAGPSQPRPHKPPDE